MKTLILNEAKMLSLCLQANGYSEKNPLVLAKRIAVDYIIECAGNYEHIFPFIVESLWPEGGTVVIKGRECTSQSWRRGRWRRRFIDNEVKIAIVEEDEKLLGRWSESYRYDITKLLNALTSTVYKPIEGDYYTISKDENGKKIIHVNGYLWESEGKYHSTEVCWFLMPLDEFVKKYSKDGNDFVEETYEALNQYQEDFKSVRKATDTCQNYFNRRPAKALLPFAVITRDTPCGNYINLC